MLDEVEILVETYLIVISEMESSLFLEEDVTTQNDQFD